MKKTVTVIMILFSAVIVFFSVYGEALYYSTKPDVTVYRAQNVWTDENGKIKLIIPKSCIVDGEYVYTISQTQGFSLIISTLCKKEIEVSEYEPNELMVIVENGLEMGTLIVLDAEGDLSDGIRVNCLENPV